MFSNNGFLVYNLRHHDLHEGDHSFLCFCSSPGAEMYIWMINFEFFILIEFKGNQILWTMLRKMRMEDVEGCYWVILFWFSCFDLYSWSSSPLLLLFVLCLIQLFLAEDCSKSQLLSPFFSQERIRCCSSLNQMVFTQLHHVPSFRRSLFPFSLHLFILFWCVVILKCSFCFF